MKKILKNYKSTIIMLIAIAIGVVIGICFKEKANVLKPFGDIFLNMLLVVIVPLIFLSVTSSITKMEKPKRIGKIVASIIGVFIVISILAVLIGFTTTQFVKLVDVDDGEKIKTEFLNEEPEISEETSIASKTVDLLTADDFTKLFSRENIIALLIFSILTGIAINMTGEKGEPFKKVLNSANEVIGNLIKIIMYYAPIGLACYIAAFIGSFGSAIAVGYLKTFVVYTIVSVLYFIIMYTLYAFLAGGKDGVKAFWKNVLPPTATAIGTCSSAACIPVNVEACKKIGVPDDIAETTVPLGTSFHKDGSIIGSVFKLMFLASLFEVSLAATGDILKALGVSLLATLLVMAVPIGGGTISETLIITMMGFPIQALPILLVIATVIDAPATMLNAVGDTASSMLVARIVDGKNWQKKSE